MGVYTSSMKRHLLSLGLFLASLIGGPAMAQNNTIYRLDGNDKALPAFWAGGTNLADLITAINGGASTIAPGKLSQAGATNGQGLVWNGTAWAPGTVGGALTIGTTAISGGTSGRLIYNNGGVLGEAATLGNLTEATSSVLTITGGTSAIIGSGLTIQVKAASSTQDGYLSSTDWSTFNGKQAAISSSTTLTMQGLAISGASGNGYIYLKNQSVAAAAIASGNVLYSDSSGNPGWRDSGGTAHIIQATNQALALAGFSSITGTLPLANIAQGSATSGQVLAWNGTAWAPAASSSVSAANPSASVGLTAVNGSATTFMRSDAAPALNVAITPTWTGAHIWSTTSLATTPTAFATLKNTTAAAAGAQQVSPSVVWSGNGWKTTATAASQQVDFRAYVLPVQGSSAPSGQWLLGSQINGGGFTDVVKVDTAGTITSSGSAFFLTGGTYGFSVYNVSGGYWCIARADQAGGTQTFEWSGSNTNGNIRGDFGIGTAMASADAVLSRRAAKVLGIVNSISGSSSAGNAFSLGSQTVSQLTAAATAGQGAMAYVTDATSTTAGSNVAGGGSNKALVISDGTNWKIVVGF